METPTVALLPAIKLPSVVSPPFPVETLNVASLLAIELPSVVSPPFDVETSTVASLLAIELPSVVSPPFAVETPTVSVLYSPKESILELVSHLIHFNVLDVDLDCQYNLNVHLFLAASACCFIDCN